MNIAIIFAGGVGRRMKYSKIPKQFLKLNGKEIIIHTIEHFQRHSEIDAIVVACVADWHDHLHKLLKKYRIDKVKRIVPGGETGQLSIYNGLCAARDIADESHDDAPIVLIHDGVRPLINEELISINIQGVKENGSAVTTTHVKETLLVVVPESGQITQVPDRSRSRIAKAPQSFFLKDIMDCHEKANSAMKHDFIDSCTMMHYYGKKLNLVDGPDENIKITTPEDYYIARAYIEARENNKLYYGE